MADTDWMNAEQPSVFDTEAIQRDKEEEHARAIEFARNYEIFITDPRGKAILEQWDTAFRRRRTPVDSSVQVYAAAEAVRAFIEDIYAQIALAQERAG